PFAVYWLARRWGLDRPAAWAAGVIYTTSGFFISAANFYNLIAGVTLTPALMAAMLWAFEETTDGTEPPRPPRRRWSLAVVAGLWALLLLSGDPTTALVALVMSGTGLLLFRGRWVLPIDRLLPVLGALTLGALVTAPQWIEFLRILPLSSRGYHGVSDAGQVVGGFEPVQLLEGVLPYVFGRPDLVRLGAFWGHRFYGGTAPLFFTLYPGLLAVALAALALLSDGPRTRRLRIAALWAMGLGVALALGEHNPLVNLVRRLPGADLLRFPIKFWLPVALGLALLAGAGFERWARSTGVIPQQPGDPEGEDGRREEALARRGLLGLVTGLWVAYLVLWSILSFVPRPVQTLLRSWIPSSYSVEFVANERVRLAGLALVSLVFLLAMLAALLVALRAPRTGGVLLLVTHTAGQLFLLQPGLATDDIDAYLTPPPLLASIPADSRLVHGSVDGLFGDLQLRVNKPWTKDLQRQMFLEMFPPAGILAGRRYELNRSPEGLASYFTWVARDAVSHSDDVQRLRLLASWGVNRLLVARPLDPAASSQAHLLASQPTVGEPVRLFAVRDATPE
ncbi:MAG: hypothetical protein KDD47_01500, partial [Acidobacteria bacterium]|nr:hypothetical protein [Acidobacteriota bacterium]